MDEPGGLLGLGPEQCYHELPDAGWKDDRTNGMPTVPIGNWVTKKMAVIKQYFVVFFRLCRLSFKLLNALTWLHFKNL